MRTHLASLAILLALTPVAFAHGDGSSFEKQIGNKLIDVGYDPTFKVGEETLLDFALYDMKGKTTVGLSNFDGITASLSSGSIIQSHTALKIPDFGKAFFTFTPQKAGHWNFFVSFHFQDKEIAAASFPVLIADSDSAVSDASSMVVDPALIGMLVIALGCLRYYFKDYSYLRRAR